MFRILLLLLVGFLLHRAYLFGKGLIDSRRASSLVQTAEAQLRSGENAEALKSLRLAITLDPENPLAARLMARALDAEGSPLALEYFHLLESAGLADAEDYRRMALCAAKHGQREIALTAAASHRNLTGSSAFPLLVEARFHAAAGDPLSREKALRAALAQRVDAETLGALTEFLLSDPEILDLNASEAVPLLRQLSEIDRGPGGLQAIRMALVSGVLSREQMPEWIALYRAHPASDVASRLDAAEIEIGQFPATSPQVVQRLVESFSSSSPTDQALVARWLVERDNPAAAQAVLPLEKALAERQTLEIWLEAAIALGQWERLESVMAAPIPNFPDSARLPLLARAMKERGRPEEAATVRDEALRRFQSDPAAFIEVLDGVLAAGEWEVLEKNLPVLLNDPRLGSEALQELIPVARSHRDSARLLGFYEKAIRSPFLAQDPFLIDRMQFNRLILGKPVAIEDIEFRLQEVGTNASFRITAALGLLLNDRRARALRVLEEGETPVDPDSLAPQARAVYAAVLAANGRRDEAAKIASGIPRKMITREEEAFLKKALAD